MSAPVVTRDEYMAAFETWFRVCRESDRENVRSIADEVEPQFRAAVGLGGLPKSGPVDAFCDILSPRMGGRRGALSIVKSNFLARALYGREPLRTVKCPRHRGRWSGVEMPPDWEHTNHCPYGCQLTGWVPVGHVMPTSVPPDPFGREDVFE